MKQLQIARPDQENKLRYGLFDDFGRAKIVEGHGAVEQLVAKLLLTDQGTDADLPASGGSLRFRTAQHVTPDNLRTRISEIGRAVAAVESQIRATQQGLDLPPSERLSRIDVNEVNYGFESQTWTIVLSILMEDGNAGQVLLT